MDRGAQTPKRAQVQEAVLAATEELLASGATYAELGVERIATAAGISRTAFYFYFRDKRELLMRLTEEVSGELFAQADRWFSSADADPREELREALAGIAALYAQHGPLLRAVNEVSTYDEVVGQYWRDLVGRFVDATQRRLEDDQLAGAGSATHARETAFALVWMVERVLYQWLVQTDAMDAERTLQAIYDVWEATIYGPRG